MSGQRGRPRLGEGKKVPVTVWLSPVEVLHCEWVGEGTASAGLRNLVRASLAEDREGTDGDVADVEEMVLAGPRTPSVTPERANRPTFVLCGTCRRKGISCDACRKQVAEGKRGV